MSALRSKGSPAQLAVRRLHSDVLELTSTWAPLNTRLAALAQAAVNAHLQLGFAHSASMGALRQFSQLQDRLESKMYTNFQRQLDDIYATFVSMVDLVGSVFDSIHRFMDHVSSCPDNAHSIVFKSSSLEDFASWARSIFEMHCKELHIKQSILLAFGCADAMAASAWRDQPAVFHDAAWCPFRTFAAPATESAEGASAAHLAVPSITSASAISDATSGRLATATEDTLTLYLDVLILEPYLDTDNLSIALDSFSFELA